MRKIINYNGAVREGGKEGYTSADVKELAGALREWPKRLDDGENNKNLFRFFSDKHQKRLPENYF